MSTNRNPLYLNATGQIQLFSGEDTFRWDFTSATGNPMELLVSASTYFTFERDGSFTLEKDVTWNADSGGSVGDQYDLRPANVNVASTVAVGAVSGTGVGAKLELNTLTLGHADVDKYIDAEQGLANTPAIRYNAVNARWEFSDNGIAYTSFNAGFGTTSWDALYAADKTLIIDSTRLTFTQTATTDVAFALTRNLASASTDAPIVLVEQQNVGDDQPGLAVAQSATSASALDIYEGTLSGGTIRYGFGATGQLTLTTNATLADSAVHIIQNDTDQPFFTAEGTSGAGASVSISTDNGATADMLQVTVDGGTPNKRWIPAYTNTTLPGTVSWDGVYLLDKHLDIDSTVLQFEQTSTTGRGFEIFRNLTATSTDAPVVVMEQQHASDDQPPLAIGQLASAADVLRLYDGSVTSGTLRFQFEPQGRLNIVTNAVLGSEALRIEQNDDDVAFAEFKGTAAAGSSKNISTDNSTTADMLRVDVDDGGGAATRWVPAYSSTTLPGAPTWDAIYLTDKILNINSTVLTFDQSSTTGIAFTVSRNLAAASTDSPIMLVDQTSGLDDQPALRVAGGIADVVANVPAMEVLGTSGGMATGAGNILVGYTATVATHATDAAGSVMRAYEANVNTAAGGNATNVGFWAGAGFDSGFYSESPVAIQTPASTSVSLDILQSDLTANGIDINGVGSNTGDALAIDGNWTVGIDCDSPVALSAPVNSTVLTISPGNPTSPTDFVTITGTSGGLDNEAMKGLVIDLTGDSGDLNSTPVYGMELDYTTGGGSDNSQAIRIGSGWDFGFFVQSFSQINHTLAVSPNLATAALKVAQQGSGDIIELRDGTLSGGTVVYTIGETGGISHTPVNPTGAFDAHAITLTSGGLGAVTAKGVDLSLVGAAGDTGSSLYGIDIAYTDNGGSYAAAGLRAINIDANWDYGIFSGSNILLETDAWFVFGGGANSRFLYSTGQTPDSLMLTVPSSSNSIVICQTADWVTDFAHALETDPTIFIQSADIVNIGEFLGLSYLGLSGDAMTTDKAAPALTINAIDAWASAVTNQDGGNVVLTSGAAIAGGTPGQVNITSGSNPTLTHILHDVSLASGGADGTTENLRAMQITTTGNASDTNSLPIYGLTFSHTDGGGSELATAILIETGYENGIALDSNPGAADASVAICNNGTGGSFYIGDGTLAGIGSTTVNRLIVNKDGSTSIFADNSSNGLYVSNADAGGSARLLRLVDGNATVNRFDVNQNGQVLIEADVADSGLKVTQDNGTTTTIFEAAEGTQSSHTARFQVQKHGAVTCTPANPTTGMDVLDVTVTSGGMTSQTLKGIDVNMTTSGSDATANDYYGIDLNMTDAGGTSTTIAIEGTGDWDKAFEFDSDPAASAISAAICNAGTNASNLLYMGVGTVAQIGGTNTDRFIMAVDGVTELFANHGSSAALAVRQNGAGSIFQLLESTGDNVLLVTQTGQISIDIDDDTNGLRLGNNGTTTNLLELIDGTISAGTQRMLVADTGKVTITTSNDLASEAIEINQADADQEFVYFNGTATDPAAGSVPADNITEINGAGAVVGPQTTSGSPDTGWAFNGMVKMKVDAVGGGTADVWIATYTVTTS